MINKSQKTPAYKCHQYVIPDNHSSFVACVHTYEITDIDSEYKFVTYAESLASMSHYIEPNILEIHYSKSLHEARDHHARMYDNLFNEVHKNSEVKI